jgi:hypothetical protein
MVVNNSLLFYSTTAHPHPLFDIYPYVCKGAALRRVFNALCSHPVGWSWPALVYILHICWTFHYKMLACSFLMFVTYASRKCCTWQLNRKLLHIPSGNMAWQCPSVYQCNLNNKKCHRGNGCENLAPSYCPRQTLHLHTGQTAATHHDYLVAYIQAKVSAARSGIREGHTRFRKIININ